MNTYLPNQSIYEYLSDTATREHYLTYIHRIQRTGPYVDPIDILDQVMQAVDGKQPPAYTTYEKWLRAACRLLVSQARWKFYHAPQAKPPVYGLTTLDSTPPEPNIHANQLIDTCLPMLTAKQREVIQGLYYLNDSRAVVAKRLGCTPQSVELTHQRALKRIKKILSNW